MTDLKSNSSRDQDFPELRWLRYPQRDAEWQGVDGVLSWHSQTGAKVLDIGYVLYMFSGGAVIGVDSSDILYQANGSLTVKESISN